MSEDHSPALLSLPEVLDGTAAHALQATLLTLRGTPLRLAADQVSRVGSLSLQVLVSAVNLWKADGNSLAIVSPSPALTEAARLTGLAQALNIGKP